MIHGIQRIMGGCAAIFLVLLLSAGCENDHRRRVRYVNSRPGLSEAEKTRILNGRPEIGMSKQEVLTTYGFPSTEKDDGRSAVWTYSTTWGGSKRGVLRFYDGRLVDIQVDHDAY